MIRVVRGTLAMMITENEFSHHGTDGFALGPLLQLTWIPQLTLN